MTLPTSSLASAGLPDAAAIPSRDHRLTPDEVAHFDEHGYVILRDRIRPALLERLQRASERWIADGQARGEGGADDGDYNWASRPSGRVLYRVNYLHNKGESASLELLGSPEMLGIAESLAGADFVPTYESLVFKNTGDGAPIDWHQDAVHPRNHRIFNVDVYLDESRKGAGSLRVAPGSQKHIVDVCDLQERYGWDAPGVVQTELNPGDVLVHDVMLVHGSEATIANKLRRTIYYEFRPAQQILEEGPWDASFIEQRLRLVSLGIDEWRRHHPGDEGFRWNIAPALRPILSDDVEAELKVAHGVHTPGSWCSAGSVTM
ncbi:phytanoyl-CoA dioxygenase family protein [Microbacterium sp. BK668]|uniref:phytanoyl-CoA dioxygenase family protein n=1 Tax=Microbacterium sp. BK668 TaxID=2512118 RepID=UPI00105BB997|nr:phytanoyl-CoA dioxygenase family protein [Microbacterium sp. BK668]TDN90733.1 ectoine hydroxylase-related dioxygenase (phytanoyl-CoA dioxygenase family) [Microbacterium sp. BK668]